jgi:hypothetical protein
MKREQGQIDRVIAVHGLRLCVYPVTSYIKGSNVVKPDVIFVIIVVDTTTVLIEAAANAQRLWSQ